MHPTLLLTLSDTWRPLVGDLETKWKERLGLKAHCLEIHDASVQDLSLGVRGILDYTRVRKLEEHGYTVVPALNLVLLAEANDPQLREITHSIVDFLSTQGHGLDTRLHIVLLWPEKDDPAHLDYLAPAPDAPVPTRVWPLCRWTKRGMWLSTQDSFRTWLQYFVEILLLKDSPLNPPLGRQWAGLGIAKIEWGQPDPCHYLIQLWQAVLRLDLGSAHPPLKLALPDLPSVSPPKNPEDRNPDESPRWQEEDWKEYRQTLQERASATMASFLNNLEDWLSLHFLQRPLREGLPQLQETIRVLKEKDEELQEQQTALLEELERLLGLEGIRARKQLLDKQRERGHPINAEELRVLSERLEPFDKALETGSIDFFLDRDSEFQEAKDELKKLEEAFDQTLANCQEAASAKMAQPPSSVWARILRQIKQILLFNRSSANQASANLPCERAWRILERAYRKHEVIADRHHQYLSLWMKLDLLGSIRLLIREYVRRASETLSFASSLKIEGCPGEEPQVFRYIPAREVPPPLLEEEAHRLVKKGILDFVAAKDIEGLQISLLEGAERLVNKLKHADPGTISIPDDEWGIVMNAAAPLVPTINWPEHQHYTYVLGSASPNRWTEPLITDRDWKPGETLVLRLVYPLLPEHILQIHNVDWQVQPQSSPVPSPPPVSKDEEGVMRVNSLIDEILEGMT